MPLDLTELPLQAQLADTEWWPVEKMLENQFQQIALLRDHAWNTVPFYRDRLARAGLEAGKPLDPDRWRRLQPLTRRDIQQSGDALHSTDVPDEHGDFLSNRTSGSTGMPVIVRGTEIDAYYFKAFELRTMLWHGFDFGGKLAAIRMYEPGTAPYPDGATGDRWGDEATFPFVTGPAAALNLGTATIREQAEWLRRQDPDYLTINPRAVDALIDVSTEEGWRPGRLKKILTTGEVLYPEWRARCREEWGADIVDLYSAQELGHIALQCPEHDHYHVQSENCLVEIIDDRGRPCAPGEIGRVLVTPLHNFAMPLFRYDIGDYAEAGGACPCGRGLPVLSRVMGREKHMLVTPAGDRHWPFFGAWFFADVAPVSQYQFIQKSLDRMEARLVVDRPLTDGEIDALRNLILSFLPCPFDIDFVWVDTIPRNPGGKYEEFRNELTT